MGKRARKVRRPASSLTRNVRAGRRDAEAAAARAGRRVEKASENPWFERMARFGYVVRGMLYAVMGLAGMGFAFGLTTKTVDQRGALDLLQGNPLKVAVAVAVIAGLAAYSLWGFVRAVYDPLHRGDEPQGLLSRAGFVWSGLSYAGLLAFTVQFLLGITRGDGSDSIEKPVRYLMAHPFGVYLTLLVGAVATVAGLGQFVDAVIAGFRKDLRASEMSEGEERAAEYLGRFGMFARGVIFTMLGVFIIEAALHHDPTRAEGMGAAFRHLATLPAGHLILFIVSTGFVALALHSFANARWVKMGRSRRP
ncbi:MAG: DUF1206 domain-containing protein [Candidatus Dormibacteria bacterium]